VSRRAVKRKVINCCLYIFLLLTGLRLHAQFPYTESFTSGSIGAKTVFGNSTTLVGGVLQLTNDQEFQKGYLYIDIPFSSTYGIKTSFEYFDYGGTGADGMTFFLFDASIQNPDFQIGAFGGSLGYAQRNTDPGLKGAYMGVGFDEYGNFGSSSEGKIGGLVDSGVLVPNSVIIRGPESENFKYIAGVQTNTAPLNFNIGSQTPARVTDPNTPGYRKVYIDLQPLAVGYTVIVKMDIGGVAGTKTILSTSYPYPAPPSLKIGFAGSTGGSTNFHEIDNILIEVSNTVNLENPLANADSASVCADVPGIVLNVLSNDVLRNDAPTYFDPATLDLDPSTAGIQNTYSVSGKGVFTANADGTVTFTGEPGTSGTVAEAYYTITDNYNKTSNQSKIRVVVLGLPDLQVNPNLSACMVSDLRTVITGDYSGLTLQYYKLDPDGSRVSRTEAQISNLSSADSGTYSIMATSDTGCSIEKQISVVIGDKPSPPVISLAF